MGQEHVTRTLQNAIRLGKVGHAYLFCGTRGTGKTTTARLLAKALNCEHGPTPNPCNQCHACVSITEGSAIDIVEMDAASHRGIGDVKDINENVKFPPMELRYKVFIIDEAHQLSNDAKDAFLKTLEEPPAHAIFILATTEPQSIPITIRSRCQQFDFRRGSLRDLRERLRYVAESEGVKVDEAALDLMAANADGSWRDALSLLEQVLAYTDGEVGTDDVNTVLGTVTQDFLFRLADAIADGNEETAFDFATEAVESGKDIQQLLKSAAQHFRNLLFASVAKSLEDVTTNEETASRLKEQALKFSKRSLLRGVEVFAEAEREARHTDQHRLILELALLKIIEATRPAEQASVVAASEAVPREVSKARPESVKPKPSPAQSTVPQPTQPTTPAPETPTGVEQRLPEFDRIKAKWKQVLQLVRSMNVAAYSLFQDVVLVGTRDNSLVLRFKYQGHKDLIEKETGKSSKKQALLTAVERIFGVANVGIICEVAPQETLVPPPDQAGDDDLPNPFDEDAGQETLKNVLEIFPGTIVDE